MAARGMRDDGEQPSLDEVTATVRSLVDVMRGNGLTELDVSAGSVSIRLRAPKSGSGHKPALSSDGASESPSSLLADISGHIVTAPMIGTFYASPAPGEAAFVGVGDFVQAGQTIGIIEAMVDYCATNSPLTDPLSPSEVANTAAFLCSPLASGITGTVVYVDKGYHAMGMAVQPGQAPAT